MEDSSLQMSSVPTPTVLRSVPAGSWVGRPSLHAADITDSLAEMPVFGSVALLCMRRTSPIRLQRFPVLGLVAQLLRLKIKTNK